MSAYKFLFLINPKNDLFSVKEKRFLYALEATKPGSEKPAEKINKYTEPSINKLESRFKDPDKTVSDIRNNQEIIDFHISTKAGLNNLSAYLGNNFFNKVGAVLFPDDSNLQQIIGTQLQLSMMESIDQEAKNLMEVDKATKIKFTSQKRGNEAVMVGLLFDEKGKLIHEFTFPFFQKEYAKFKERKEFLKNSLIAQRLEEAEKNSNSLIESNKTENAEAEKKPEKIEILPGKPLDQLTVQERTEIRNDKIFKEVIPFLENIANTAIENTKNENSEKILNQDLTRKIEFAGNAAPLKVLIDGKDTGYILDIAWEPKVKEGDYEIFFAIKKPGEKSEYPSFDDLMKEEGSSKETQIGYNKIYYLLKEIATNQPNLNPVNDREKAFEALKQNGLEVKNLNPEDPFTIHHFETLNNVAQNLQEAFKASHDIYAFTSTFRKAKNEIYPLFQGQNNVEIDFTPAGTQTTFNWKNWAEDDKEYTNYGFGNESKLINDILKAKKELNPDEKAEENIALAEQSKALKSAETKELRKAEKIDKYTRSWKKLSSKDFRLDKTIGGLDQDEMEKYWTRFLGYKKVNGIMTRYPFGLSENNIRKVATDIICGESFGNKNNLVDLEDIFYYMKGFPLVDRKKIPEKYLKDDEDFLKEFERLVNKKDITEQEAQLREDMYYDIMIPCLDVLSAISEMKAPEEARVLGFEVYEKEERTEKENVKTGLAPGQERIVNSISKLFNYSEDSDGAWDDFMEWLAGGQDKMTMSRVDGTTYGVDEGMFKRHYAPDSAILALFNKPGLYETDKDGKKILNEEKVTAELNRIMDRGYKQIVLQEMLRTKQSSEEIEAQPKYNKEFFTINNLNDIAKFKKTQLITFQLGFINDKINQFEEKIQTTEKIMADAPEGVKAILEQFKDKVPNKQLAKIKSTMIGMAGIHFHNAGDGYKAEGAGIGTGIDLGDGYTLLLGVGTRFEGEPKFLAGIGLDINVYKEGGNTVNFSTVISILGPAVAIRGSHDIGKGVEFGWDFGIGLNWANITAVGIAGGVTLNWENAVIEAQKIDLEEKAKEKSGLKELWEKWDTLNKEQKWELIQELPVYENIQKFMDENPETLNQDTIINMISQYKENVEAKEVYDKMHAIPFLPVGVGFGSGVVLASVLGGPAVAAIGFIGGLKFQLGSATIFIPHPKEESRILNYASNAEMEAKVRQFFHDAKTGKIDVPFTEKTPDIYYKPGSALGKGILVESKSIDLSELETGTENYNEALKPAEVKLIPRNFNRIELVIDNDDDKDIEIHIDPLLEELGAIVDRGRVFIEGNINDLIITRERFEFPFSVAENNASLRDVITIRSSKSILGKRDRLWINEYESHYLEKLYTEKQYRMQDGENLEEGRQNMLEARGYATDEMVANLPLEIREKIENFAKHREKSEGSINKKTLDVMSKDIDRMRTGLNAKLKSEYENEMKDVGTPEFEHNLNKLYINYKFTISKKGFLENPDNIIKLIDNKGAKFGLENLSDTQYNYAINYLTNKWFSRFYRGKEDKELSDYNLKAINKTLLNRIEKRKNWIKKKYSNEFEKIKTKLNLKSDPKLMAQKFVDDIYKGFEERLTKEPPFDFRKDLTVGKGLEPGDAFISGTSSYKLGKDGKTIEERALSKTLNFVETKKADTAIHEFGFLESAEFEIGKNYNPKTEGVEGDLAKVLLEMASPIPTNDLEFLKSPLVLKLLGLGAYRLIVEEKDGGGAKQYEAMTELMENPSAENIAKHKNAIDIFRKFVEKVRAAEIEGKPLEIKTSQGLVITLDMKATKIRSGAYSKCANGSHAVNEQGTISIKKPTYKRVHGAITVTNEVVDVEMSKRFISFGLLVGFSSTPAEKPKTPVLEKRKSHETHPTAEPRKPEEHRTGPIIERSAPSEIPGGHA